jgi:uncharacterized protein YbjT (DUF2867 family)
MAACAGVRPRKKGVAVRDQPERADDRPLILLTGATGYVGGRLLKVLEHRGHRLRCLARRPEFLCAHIGPATEVMAGDLLEPTTLPPAMRDVQVAYYLVHSMGSTGAFEAEDRQAAHNFGAAAREAGVGRIIYLGGLGAGRDTLSAHLRSRHEVGDVLRRSGIQVIEFRASLVLGSGSLSFEMIRALTERLPVMLTPRWVSIPAQPIAITDLLAYLEAALNLLGTGHCIFEIGGADQVSYGDIMREYARQRGLRRVMIPIPLLTPRVSSLWLGLVTPLYARIGRKLIESIRHPTVVCDASALQVFRIRPQGIREAIASALRGEDQEWAQTRWSDALSAAGPRRDWGGVRFGSRIVDSRMARVPGPPARAFAPIQRLGGTTGWYYGNWLWQLRGLLDLLVGGIGLRRGRRHAISLRVGDTVDWWRVEAFEPDRRLRLAAEMRLPGRAWLEFEVVGEGSTATIRQTAIFEPVGVLGLLYWYALYPWHQWVFAGMLQGLVRAIEHPTKP